MKSNKYPSKPSQKGCFISKQASKRERERRKNRISEIYASEIIIKIFASSTPPNVGFFNESGMNKNNERKFSDEENNKFYWGISPSPLPFALKYES